MSLPAGAKDATRVGGGDINEAWRVTLADGRPGIRASAAVAAVTMVAAGPATAAWRRRLRQVRPR